MLFLYYGKSTVCLLGSREVFNITGPDLVDDGALLTCIVMKSFYLLYCA